MPEVVDISPGNLGPACDSPRPAFRVVNSAYELNKQGDNIWSWCAPAPVLDQSVVPRLFLTVVSWPACRFLRSQVKWSDSPNSLRISRSLLWSRGRASVQSMKQWEMFSGAPLLFLRCNVCVVTSVTSNSARPCGLWPSRALCSWASPGKKTAVGCRGLLRGIFPTQGSNSHLLCLLHQQASCII